MPLTPAMRSSAHQTIAAASPISAPPTTA
jgi:hypothetical protein